MTETHQIEITSTLTFDIDDKTKELNFPDLEIFFNGDTAKLETWNWLFCMNDRYKLTIKSKVKGWVRELANRYKRNKKRAGGLSIEEIINDHLEDYEPDKFEELKFLKMAVLKAIKNDKALLAVYQ